MGKPEFSTAEKFLGKRVFVQIDRPLGSVHPKYKDIVYGVNYGFIPGTKSPDGEELDAYVLGVDRPVSEFEGFCIGFLRRKKDDDDKLLIVSDERVTYTEKEIRDVLAFQEKFFESDIILMK